MQLISACHVIADAQQGGEVTEKVVDEVRGLFLDTKEAIKIV